MRVALFGQAAFGRDVLGALREAGERVVGVSAPVAVGGASDPLGEAASEAGIPVLDTRSLRDPEPLAALRAWEPDLLVFAFVTEMCAARRARRAAPRDDPVPPLAAPASPRALGDELGDRRGRDGHRAHHLLGGRGRGHRADPACAGGPHRPRRHRRIPLLRAPPPDGGRGAGGGGRTGGGGGGAPHPAGGGARDLRAGDGAPGTPPSTGRGPRVPSTTTFAAATRSRVRAPCSARARSASSTRRCALPQTAPRPARCSRTRMRARSRWP